MTQLLLVPVCVLPGCSRLLAEAGHPCAECLALFDGSLGGWRIRPCDGAPETAEEVEARKAATRAAQRAADGDADEERKPNQRCWLCEDRRTCTRRPGGWECDHCARIT